MSVILTERSLAERRLAERRLASLALTLSSLAWAGNAIVGRMFRLELEPLTLSFYRWLITAVILGTLWRADIRRDFTLCLRHWAFILLGGLLGMALFHTLQYRALAETSAVNVTLMICFAPAFVAAISFVWTREGIGARQAAGIALASCGAAVIVARGSLNVLTEFRIDAGEATMCAALVCWAAYTVAIQRRPPALSGRSALFAMSFVAAALLAPGYLHEVSQGRGALTSLSHVATVTYLGVVASVFAYIAHSYGVERLGAAAGSLYLCLIPAFTTGLSVLFIAEPLMLHQVAALGLITGGIYWCQAAPARS
ncbi:DMT family transporter [Azospirillum sp. sgz302134]